MAKSHPSFFLNHIFFVFLFCFSAIPLTAQNFQEIYFYNASDNNIVSVMISPSGQSNWSENLLKPINGILYTRQELTVEYDTREYDTELYDIYIEDILGSSLELNSFVLETVWGLNIYSDYEGNLFVEIDWIY